MRLMTPDTLFEYIMAVGLAVILLFFIFKIGCSFLGIDLSRKDHE